jgi:asparagine synthase (glutamine-hydrolysing)
MCGITGIYSFNEAGKSFFGKVENSVKTLSKRGPDSNGSCRFANAVFGHTRLSVIDVSSAGNQPFTDHTGRYTIIYNGEIFNYKELRKTLLDKGIHLRSETDTEVLLYLYITEGPSCLEKLNGFFAFAIYDSQNQSLFLARDRMGIKPLLVYQDDDKIIFASEMKALLAYGIPKEIDDVALKFYLQLNYIPSHCSMIKGVKKIEPGSFWMIENNSISKKQYYNIPSPNESVEISYEDACEKLRKLLTESVQKRMVADVPVGTFLSGGIDSSFITAIAAKESKQVYSFSIGFSDEPLFDETHYAILVSKKCKTEHTVFSLGNNDLFEHLHDILNYIDEPFADSSAINIYILSKYTRNQATVALSGDGADELFAGYNKHKAEYRALNPGLFEWALKYMPHIWNVLPQSRNGLVSNKIRQISKFADGIKLSSQDRYWLWATLLNEQDAENLMLKKADGGLYREIRSKILEKIKDKSSINDVLYTDMKLVLRDDMLTKVDLMSMANSLEVRVPFLDHNLVDFAFSLPSEYKIDGHTGKKILKDAFRDYLPEELFNRPKKGFEVPLLKWFRTELNSYIFDDLLNEGFVMEQGIFNYDAIRQLKNKLFSNQPGDSVANLWALVVFQNWWKKYMV